MRYLLSKKKESLRRTSRSLMGLEQASIRHSKNNTKRVKTTKTKTLNRKTLKVMRKKWIKTRLTWSSSKRKKRLNSVMSS